MQFDKSPQILVGMIPMPTNRFLCDLNSGISEHGCDIIHDYSVFWGMKGSYDIVHLHFPEYISYEIEACIKGDSTPGILSQLQERLSFWKERAPLIVTRHVLLPHHRQNMLFQDLYEMVYRYADAVVHFGKASIEEYHKRYQEKIDIDNQLHRVIPHHNYESLPNTITREQARDKLGIRQDANVIMLFGAMRNEWERTVALNTFKNLKVKHKVLLVSRWRERLANVRWVRLKYLLRDLTRLYYQIHPQYYFNYEFVEEDDIQLYAKAADVFFVPRGHVLNSGNMITGFTFGNVVVGPDSHDVGELLRETGNPVFDPDSPDTAVAAVEEGIRLAKEGLGHRNREMALREWSVDKVAGQYVNLFQELIEERKKTDKS